jgi:hypothetical protein
MKDIEVLARQRLVVVPPDRVLGLVVTDDELVLRRAARVLSRYGPQGAVGCEFRVSRRL